MTDVPSWAAQSDTPAWATAVPSVPAWAKPTSDNYSFGTGVKLGVRNVIRGAAELGDMISSPVTGAVDAIQSLTHQKTIKDLIAPPKPVYSGHGLTEAANQFADQMGLPREENRTQRLVGSGVEGATQGLLTAGGGLATQGVKGATGIIGKALASSPALDVASGASSGVSSQGAAEAGAGPLGQFAAGLVGGLAPSGVHIAAHLAGVPMPTSPFVNDMFKQRGVDTTPTGDPRSNPLANRGMSPQDREEYHHVLAHGSEDDINNFYANSKIINPDPSAVREWVSRRDAVNDQTAPPDYADQMFHPVAEVDMDTHAHRQTVQDHIDQQTSTWKNKPDVELISHVDDIQDPTVREQARREGAQEDAVGFLGTDGKVRIFHDRVHTPEQVNAVLYHEALGHYGLQEKFGVGLDRTLETLVARNVGSFGKDVKAWMAKNPGAYKGSVARAADEVLAERSSKGPLKPALMDALESHIRRFGRQMGLDLKYNDAEVSHILAMAHDAVINGKGRNVIANQFRGPNRYMYAGKQSETAPKIADDFMSKVRQSMGIERKEWFKGADGQDRYEISDHNATLKNWDELKEGKSIDFEGKNPSYKLEDVLSHPELYKAYPELKDVKVTKNPSFMDFWDSIQGWFNPKTGILNVAPKAMDPKSTMLHEIQHWIQHKEGWSQGGNQDSVRLDDHSALNKLSNFYNRKFFEIGDPTKTDKNNIIQSSAITARSDLKSKIARIEELKSNDQLANTYKQIDKLNISLKAAKLNLKRFIDKFESDHAQAIKEFETREQEYKSKIGQLNAESEAAYQNRDWDKGKLLHTQIMDLINSRPSYPSRNWEARNSYREIANTKIDDIEKQLTEVTKQFTDVKGKYSDLSFDLYKLIAGEREARDVQARQHLGPEERTQTTPYSHEGIRDDEVIHNTSLGDEDEPSMSKFITRAQMDEATSGTYVAKEIDTIYKAMEQDYVPVVKTRAQTIEDAHILGFSPSQIKSLSKTPELAVRSARMTQSLNVMDARLNAVRDKIRSNEYTPKDLDEARQIIADQMTIGAKIRDERAEYARALAISKLGYTRKQIESFGKLLEESGGTLSPLGNDDTLLRFLRKLDEMNKDGNTNGTALLMKSLAKPNWEDYVTTFHQNMMLSGVSTHFKAPQDMAIGISRELLEAAGALPISMGKEALRAVGVDIKPGIHPTEVMARLGGIVRAFTEAETYRNTARTFMEGGVNPNGFGGKNNARIPGISKVTDLISAQDAFFRAFATNMHLYGLGTRQAVNEARAAGGKINWDDVLSQGASYARTPSKELLAEAKLDADKTLLLNKNKLTAGLDRVKNVGTDANFMQRVGSFVANFLTPFVRVESNSLVNRIIRRSPLAFIDSETRADLKAGGARSDLAMSRILYGTAGIASYWMAAGKGKTTGNGPDNQAKKAEMMATGWRPQAVHENGQYNTGDKLGMSVNPFDVHNQTATMVASMREAFDKDKNQGSLAIGLKMAMYSMMKSMTEMSWINDIAPAVEAATAPDATLGQKVDRFAGEELSTMVPNVVGQSTRIVDQAQPDISDKPLLGPTESALPGLRQGLPARMTPYGNPVQGGASLLGTHSWLPQDNRFTGGNHVDETHDPVELELSRISGLMRDGKALVTGVNHNISIDDPSKFDSKQVTSKANGSFNVKLNAKQISEYQHMVGREIVEHVRQEMNSPDWAQMSDEDKAHEIKDIEKDMKKAVKEHLYGS